MVERAAIAGHVENLATGPLSAGMHQAPKEAKQGRLDPKEAIARAEAKPWAKVAKTLGESPQGKQQASREQAKRGGTQMGSKASVIIAWNMAIVQSGARKQAKAEQEAR